MIPDTLADLRVPIDGLTPYAANPRQGNIDVIVDSLQRHGQYRPIVVRAKTFEVLAGNHTLAAARHLGWTEIAATFVDVTDDEAARIVLVDNRSSDLGTYDDALLLDLLTELDGDLLGTGWDTDDLADLARLIDSINLASDTGDLASEVSGGLLDLDADQVGVTVIIPKDRRTELYAALAGLDFIIDARDAVR